MEKYNAIISKAQSLVKDPLLLNSNVATCCIHAGHNAFEHPGTGYPIAPPITLSTTFKQKAPSNYIKYDYSRAGNYSREALEKTIAAMENAKYCCTFSSGLGTQSSLSYLLKHGDHVLFSDDVYGGVHRYFTKIASKFNIICVPIDMHNIETFQKELKLNTKMVWIESPSNPLMNVVDIKKICEVTKSFNPDIIIVVDNTFATPVFQLPLNLGADIVMHSLTKYMNGHYDVLMGSAATNNETLFQTIEGLQYMIGSVPSPFDCYMVLRGLKTLTVRMIHHQLNGLAVALFLSEHPKIEKVFHPALLSSPHKEIVERQMTGYSGMLSAYVKGSLEDVSTFIQSLKYFQLAESLGGFESLIEIPSLMSHDSLPPERRKLLGITDNLVRISVGIESIYDLLEDLSQGLDKIK